MSSEINKVNLTGKNNIEAIEILLRNKGITVELGKNMLPFKVNGPTGHIPLLTSMSTRQACEWLATRTGIKKT